MACRNGGTVSVIGVYGGLIDKFPLGAVMNRSLTIKTGQCHVHRYMRPLLERIENGEIDPVRRHHPSPAACRCGEGLRHFRQQSGQLRKSRNDCMIATGSLSNGRVEAPSSNTIANHSGTRCPRKPAAVAFARTISSTSRSPPYPPAPSLW